MARSCCLCRGLAIAVSAGGLTSAGHAVITVTSFAPSAFNANAAAMDATLGITGYTVETFNDTTLATGLRYELSAPSAYGPSSLLPATVLSTVSSAVADNHWDDLFLLLNNNTNAFPDNGDRAVTTTFFPPAGTGSFGMGISSAQSSSLPNQFPIADHELFINGVSFGLLESLPGFTAGRNRNIYLRIDATGADSVQSVALRTLNNRTDELMVFDHIAFVPAPGAAALLGLSGLVATRRRRAPNA